MNRTRTLAGGTVAAAIAFALITGCAVPGSASARSGISVVSPSAVASSAEPAPASSAEPAPASSGDPGLGDTRPPCAPAQSQPILGPNVTRSVWTSPTVHRPFGDVGVNFGPQLPGATVLWARLDVVVTDPTPLPIPDPASPQAYETAEAARPDSEAKLAAGTDPHVARVTLMPFAPGPFVLPAAVLNALPTGADSYTVYLVDSVDESVCYSTASGSPAVPPVLSNGYSVIAELAP